MKSKFYTFVVFALLWIFIFRLSPLLDWFMLSDRLLVIYPVCSVSKCEVLVETLGSPDLPHKWVDSGIGVSTGDTLYVFR